MLYRQERRPSSTTLRRRCIKYWVQPDGHMRCQNPHCGVRLHPEARKTWEADHLVLWTWGGSDFPPNVRPLCIDCHRHKSRGDIFKHAKLRRGIKKRNGEAINVKRAAARKVKPRWGNRKMQSRPFSKGHRPMMGSCNSPVKRKYDRKTKRFITVWRDDKRQK